MPGTYVDQEMLIETVSPAELLAAMLTLVNLDILMTQPVVVQTVLCHETLATHAAQVGVTLGVIHLGIILDH